MSASRRYRDAPIPTSRPSSSACWRGELPDGWQDALPDFAGATAAGDARVVGRDCINALAAAVPELVGGSADLAPSTNTLDQGRRRRVAAGQLRRPQPPLRHPRARHGLDPQRHRSPTAGCGRSARTFLIFSDYMRPAVRLACLMELPAIYVWTHDSVCLGEDGPTHQPIEHLMALRAIPRMRMLRPGDADEIGRGLARSRSSARDGPDRARALAPGPAGARPLGARAGGGRAPRRLRAGRRRRRRSERRSLMGTGSEVHDAARGARDAGRRGDRRARRLDAVLGDLRRRRTTPTATRCCRRAVWRRVSIEAGATFGWQRWWASGASRSASTASAPRRPVTCDLAELGISPERRGGGRAPELRGG